MSSTTQTCTFGDRSSMCLYHDIKGTTIPFALYNHTTENLDIAPTINPLKRAKNLKKFQDHQKTIIANNIFTAYGIILFQGNDLIGKIIRHFTRSLWSHVGLLVKNREGLVHVFESVGSPFQFKSGITPRVQINYLTNEYLQQTGAKMVVQSLFVYNHADHPSNLNYHLGVNKIINEFLGRKYKQNFFPGGLPIRDLPLAAFEKNWTENQSTVFCSELVALCMQAWGLMDMSKLSNNYVPGSFNDPTIGGTIMNCVLGPQSNNLLVEGNFKINYPFFLAAPEKDTQEFIDFVRNDKEGFLMEEYSQTRGRGDREGTNHVGRSDIERGRGEGDRAGHRGIS